MWVHLDDESKVAEHGTKSKIRWAFLELSNMDDKSKDKMIKLQAQEIKDLEGKLRISQSSAIENKNVAELNADALSVYEIKLQKQLKDIAREITKVYQAKHLQQTK